MADVKDRLNEVPSWDGSSKTWRRYCKEVGWYLSGTKSSQRKYVAAKLISRLSGAARLLSMSWHQRDFEGEEGVQVMLRRFASSPLVRRSLPNAAATMSSYFMFQRRPGESIAQFLVRETLGFEEFQEALLQLKEEKDGISPADRLFELPEITTSETSDKGERYYNPWHRDQRWRDWEETPFEEQVEQTVDAPEGYAAVPQTSDAGEEAAPHSPAGSPNRTRQTQRSPSRKTEQQRMIDGLGPMDSFILDVLRGWRLLVAASLTNDEWRDILASTGNKLDYPAIAEALQTLWDEQLNHHHGASKGTVLQQHWVETADPWYNAAWHESSWDTEDWHESDWHSMDQFGDGLKLSTTQWITLQPLMMILNSKKLWRLRRPQRPWQLKLVEPGRKLSRLQQPFDVTVVLGSLQEPHPPKVARVPSAVTSVQVLILLVNALTVNIRSTAKVVESS